MAIGKQKTKEKKTPVEKLLESALFILLLVILMIVDVLEFVIWLSDVLSSKLQGKAIYTTAPFFTWVGLTAGLLGLWVVLWGANRALRKKRGAPHA